MQPHAPHASTSYCASTGSTNRSSSISSSRRVSVRMRAGGRRAPLPGKPLNPSERIQLDAQHRYTATFKPFGPEAPIQAYMQALAQDFGRVQMPLGAQLKKLDKAYEILAPRIQILDFYLEPKAKARLSTGVNFMSLTTNECVLDGSQIVRDLKLNDVFNISVEFRVEWDNGRAPRVSSIATIAVDAAIPFPLNTLPNPAMEATGNAAFSTTLRAMLDDYVQSMRRDYEAWGEAQQRKLQQQGRQQPAQQALEESPQAAAKS